MSVCDGPVSGAAPRCLQNQTPHRSGSLEEGEGAADGEHIQQKLPKPVVMLLGIVK